MADMPPFEVRAATTPEGTRVSVAGELDLANARQFGECLHAAITREESVVIVDLSNLSFIDSSGLNALVRAKHRADAVGTRLILRNLTATCRTAFEVAALDEFFEIDETAD